MPRAPSVEPPGDASARDRILHSAAVLFPGARIRVTGVDALIEGAGVAKATFYRHFPSKDDVVAAWLEGSQARWLDAVVAGLEEKESTPLGRLVGFWEAMGAWAEADGFRGCPYLNTLGEIRDRQHPAFPAIRSFISEVESYLSKTATEAEIPGASELARELLSLAMGTWTAMVFEASARPASTARAVAVTLVANRLGTSPEEIEHRIARI
ncbi:MAG: TetR/AcrR family transcriptional regulator [Gaiellales bacterium]